jgi:hypothetical protein
MSDSPVTVETKSDESKTVVELKSDSESKSGSELKHPVIGLTLAYINAYENLMNTSKKEINGPMETLDMLSSLIGSIERFVLGIKHEDHKTAESKLFPNGYKHLSNELETFSQEQLMWLLNQMQMNGAEIDPELEEEEMKDESKIAEWFRGFLKNKMICRHCKDLGHQYTGCPLLNVMPCALCGNSDHYGTECNSSKAKLMKNKGRPLNVRGRGGRGRGVVRGRGGKYRSPHRDNSDDNESEE